MSINNSMVVINSLTATIIKHENTIEDLNASIKRQSDSASWINKYSELADDHDKLIKQLADCKEAANNKPKDETPYTSQLEQQAIQANKRIESLESKNSKLAEQLEKDRSAAALLRSFFINKNQDAIAKLSQYIVDQTQVGILPLAYKAGVVALSPIEVNITDSYIKKQVQDAIEQLQRLDSHQNSKSEDE